MKKHAEPHFRLILDSINNLESYTPATRAEFVEQSLVYDAILMRFLVIGENRNRIRMLDEEQFDRMAPASWYRAIGLRNIISHGYEDVDPDEIWHTLTRDLPAFRRSIETSREQWKP